MLDSSSLLCLRILIYNVKTNDSFRMYQFKILVSLIKICLNKMNVVLALLMYRETIP